MTDRTLSFQDAVSLVVGKPEALAALPKLEQHAEPCGAKAVVALLTPLVTLYGVADRSESEWKAFWGFYIKALSDLPFEALRSGVEEYVGRGDSEFFPKPGPLKALALKQAEPLLMALGRARKAAAA